MNFTRTPIRYSRETSEFSCVVTFEDGTRKEIDGRSHIGCLEAVNAYVHQVLTDLGAAVEVKAVEDTYYQQTVVEGSRQVVISANTPAGPFESRLYLNNGETASTTVAKAKSLKRAEQQAAAMLAKYRQAAA